jgi:nicotinamidase-related amidase
MKPTWLLLAVILAAAAALPPPERTVHLPLRTRVEMFHGSNQWKEASVDYSVDPSRTALIVCDMWDKHWCAGANLRVAALVKKLEPVLELARSKGVTIVHAPSETMSFYAGAPQRQRILALPAATLPQERSITAPALPIDDSDGGCDTPGDKEHRAWTCEHPGLKIAPEDYISDNGREIYNLIHARGIETVFYTGVHANMCILNRTFAIKQMTKWGVHCVLLRDLTDAMYDPKDAPHVSHRQGTELVIDYIEKYWSPTALSTDLSRALSALPKAQT